MKERDDPPGVDSRAGSEHLDRRRLLKDAVYVTPTLVVVGAASPLSPPPPPPPPPPPTPLSLAGASPGSGVFKDMITVTGAGFKTTLEQNLVTIDDACQLDLTSVSDANTQLEGTLGQVTTTGTGPVKAFRGQGGPLPTGPQSKGFALSTSLNVGGFTRNPSPNAEAVCTTAACDNFGLTTQTAALRSPPVSASSGNIFLRSKKSKAMNRSLG
jgi:hypothetical protein